MNRPGRQRAGTKPTVQHGSQATQLRGALPHKGQVAVPCPTRGRGLNRAYTQHCDAAFRPTWGRGLIDVFWVPIFCWG